MGLLLPCWDTSKHEHESFHRFLKIVYLDGKHNRRVDHLLNTLLRIARDKVFDRISKTEKGKVTNRMTDINKRHKAASQLSVIPTKIDESQWQVQSESRDVTYTIHRVVAECSCKLRCHSCSACIHMYTCSCVDSAIHSTVCKHCHLVHMTDSVVDSTNQSEMDTCDEPPTTATDNMVEMDCLPYLTDEGSSSRGEASQLKRVKNEVVALTNEIQLIARESDNEEVVKAGLEHLRSAVSIMKALQKKTSTSKNLVPTKYIAPNANSQVQRRFHSTKRKRQASITPGLKKPTLEQMDSCVSEMSELEVKVCGICFMEDDKGICTEVPWFQCSFCSIWLHTACATLNNSIDLSQPKLCCSRCIK